tara:strand:- start:215 stop:505 length:291 start_codon:yes stop_codon:yes gene_type:complete
MENEEQFNYLVYNAIDEQDYNFIKHIIEKTDYRFTPNHYFYAILQSNFLFCAYMKKAGYAVDGLSKIIKQDGCFAKYFQPVIYERAMFLTFDKIIK